MRSGERVHVLSRPTPEHPMTRLEERLISVTWALASLTDIGREIIESDFPHNASFRRSVERMQPGWETAYTDALDLLRTVRSERYAWEGTGELVGERWKS